MTKQSTATAFDHNSTLVRALELSGKGWEVGAVAPGVTRRPRRSLPARDMARLLQQIERWKAEAGRPGRTVCRTVLAYEAGRDGFWVARYLLACGIEVQIMHPASIPVERQGRRAKHTLVLSCPFSRVRDARIHAVTFTGCCVCCRHARWRAGH